MFRTLATPAVACLPVNCVRSPAFRSALPESRWSAVYETSSTTYCRAPVPGGLDNQVGPSEAAAGVQAQLVPGQFHEVAGGQGPDEFQPHVVGDTRGVGDCCVSCPVSLEGV